MFILLLGALSFRTTLCISRGETFAGDGETDLSKESEKLVVTYIHCCPIVDFIKQRNYI